MQVAAWCDGLKQIRSRLDFQVSTRGWCYLLEAHGLSKGDFDRAEDLIVRCRKSGLLPLSICAVDHSRDFQSFGRYIDYESPADYAAVHIESLNSRWKYYTPFGFWNDQPYYIELMVEKIDLKSLFMPVCQEFYISIGNAKGWSDLNMLAGLMRRFRDAEARGQTPVLLYCGDCDPSGLLISDTLRKNMEDLAHCDEVQWEPTNLKIDRIGLDKTFIDHFNLTWIDGLKTGGGKDLTDQSHPDHFKPYVQDYLAVHGPRKCEANALVVAPAEGRALLRASITDYLPADAAAAYEERLKGPRAEVRAEMVKQIEALRRPE
jgi:hypothetical protein